MPDLRAEIESVNNRFMEAVRAGDEDGLVDLYTDDAVLLLPGREPLEGQEGVRAHVGSFKSRGVRDIRLTTLEVQGLGDTAWERGTYKVCGPEGAVMAIGKYIVIWSRTSAGWKIHRDMMNASA